jgi:hypothetical protein
MPRFEAKNYPQGAYVATHQSVQGVYDNHDQRIWCFVSCNADKMADLLNEWDKQGLVPVDERSTSGQDETKDDQSQEGFVQGAS